MAEFRNAWLTPPSNSNNDDVLYRKNIKTGPKTVPVVKSNNTSRKTDQAIKEPSWSPWSFNRLNTFTMETEDNIPFNSEFMQEIGQMFINGTAAAAGTFADMFSLDMISTANFADKVEGIFKDFVSIVGGMTSNQNGAKIRYTAFVNHWPDIQINNSFLEGPLASFINNNYQGLGDILKVLGNFSPNFDIRFNSPSVWKGSEISSLRFKTILNKAILEELRDPRSSNINGVMSNSIYKDDKDEKQIIRGKDVMATVFAILAMSSPRKVSFGNILGASRVVQSPPLVSVKFGKFVFTNCFVERVNISFNSTDDGANDNICSYDTDGFPLEARVEFDIKIPVVLTQDEWLVAYNNLLTLRNMDNEIRFSARGSSEQRIAERKANIQPNDPTAPVGGGDEGFTYAGP